MISEKRFLLRAWAFVLLAACACLADAAQSAEYATFKDLDGKRIGVVTGAFFDELVGKKFPRAQLFYFNDMADMTAALKGGEIDCIVDDEPVLRHIAAREGCFRLLPGLIQSDRYAFAARRDDRRFIPGINAALTKMREEGVLAAIVEKWLDGGRGPDDTEASSHNPDSMHLTLGVYAESPPFVFRDESGEVTGIDIDLMREICRRLSYRLDIQPMDFDSLFEALQENRVDVIASCIAITEDRRRVVTFTTAYYDGGVAAMVLSDNQASFPLPSATNTH